MSCLISERVKPLSQCGTYRLFLFSGLTSSVHVIFENIARERAMNHAYTPVLITKEGLNVSYVDIPFEDFGNFLNSGSDFEISVDRAGIPVLIYLGLDSDNEAILMLSIIAEFKEMYNTDNEKEQITLQNFEI